MSIRAGFFNSNVDGDGNYDRAEQADFFAKYFSEFISNGIYANPSDNFQVLATTGMNLTVKAGRCFIGGGYFGWQQTDDSLALEVAPLTNPRIDRIVIRLQLADEERNIIIETLKGTEAANPVAPAITRTDDTWDLVLADVYIDANISAITQADINDRRLDSNLCGIVHAVIDHIDTSTFYSQIQADMANFKNVTQADFTSWVQTLEEVLDEETAGHLLLQIQQLQEITTVMQADPNNYVVSHTDMVNGGTDYVDTDEIAINGIVPTSFSVSGGTITSIMLDSTIKYSTDPKGTFSIEGGSGTGASANIVTRRADGNQIAEGALQHVPPQDPLVQASRVRRYLTDWTKSGWLPLAPLATIYNYVAASKTASIDIVGGDYRPTISSGMKMSYKATDNSTKFGIIDAITFNTASNTTTIAVQLEASNVITGSLQILGLMYSYAETPYLFPRGVEILDNSLITWGLQITAPRWMKFVKTTNSVVTCFCSAYHWYYSSGLVICTLPDGWRPKREHVQAFGGANSSTGTIGLASFAVMPDGRFMVAQAINANVTSPNGMSWCLDIPAL